MDVNLFDILRIGFADGLVWFPFVLGVGLLYTYFKEIDISVDGIAVLSGIGCAFVWRMSDSYLLSLLAGILIGIFCSTLVCSLQTLFRISGLMAGVVFSLVAHSLSVILIGESLVLPDTHLLSGFGAVTWWQIALVAFLILLTLFFYNTRFGVAARKLGNGCIVNTVYSAGLLKCSGYALSGFLYGLGGAMYAHSQGLAKSGGSFEFLLVSLCAYLCTVRISDISTWAISLFRGATSVGVVSLSPIAMLFHQLVSSPAVKALIGAVLFETLLFLTIAVSPNPMLWKLIFAVLLLLALAKPNIGAIGILTSFRKPFALQDLKIRDLSIHYDIGSERREVFNKASGEFSLGVNLIRGPNGTGKSTLLKSIVGLVHPSEGKLTYDGQDLSRIARHLRPCFLLQQNPMDTLAQELTVTENLFVAFDHAAPMALGFRPQAVLGELMSRLHDLEVSPIRSKNDSFWKKPVMTLSGGEAHCVAFYCALLSGNPILLADEPTTGLDANNFKRLTTLLNALAKDRIVLLTSHDSRVTPLADRRFTVGGGKIQADEG